MKELLLDAKEQTEVNDLPIVQEVKTLTNKRYREILEEGFRENPEPEKIEGKRGRPKRSKTLNLLHRLKNYHLGILSFFNREGVPFDNNQAERDIRMMKTREKISAGFANSDRAKNFCDLRSIISSAQKQDQNILQTLRDMIEDPLLAGSKLAHIPE